MDKKILFLIILIVLIGFILNGDPISELKADEETDSECYNTPEPKSQNDCVDKEVSEYDDYCCYFEIENNKKQNIQICAGLTEFQYKHIKLYVKEKMDELLYRDLHIHCNSSFLKLTYLLFLFFL